MHKLLRLTWVASLAVSTAVASAESKRPYDVTERREACTSFDAQRRPHFGDLHVHTAYSMDAASQDTRNTPFDAYRFARGGEVGLQPYGPDGKPFRTAKLRRPLDFVAVTDHAEALGEVRICKDPNDPQYNADFCWMFREQGNSAFLMMAARMFLAKKRWGFCGENGERCAAAHSAAWRDIQKSAEEAYDRSSTCSFTSFVGYEWTSTAGNGMNLHRNVIYRNEKVPDYAPSQIDRASAYELWQELQKICVDGIPGCDVLTIPHNSNISGPGLMFRSAKLTTVEDSTQKVTKKEAMLRQRWEPLVEIMQHKGDSECFPGFWTTDEECGFEKLAYNSFAGVSRFHGFIPPGDPTPDRRATVREALKEGLRLEAKLGVNPLKYGIIASSDTHLGTPGYTLEDSSQGHGGAGMQGGERVGLPDDAEFNPGGLAVLWAEENTRDSLFSAMQRREAYGTSGTRPVVRFFGGWNYSSDLCGSPDFAKQGYASGVPMGSDLPARPAGAKAPTFAAWAMQDPGTAASPGRALERLQLIKGWLEGDELKEEVVDLASARTFSGVNTETCQVEPGGAGELCAVWRDSDFDSNQRAFYYLRVLESPTCRWSQQICVAEAVDCANPDAVAPGFAPCCAPEHRASIRERAWTSPIWYAP